MITDPESHPVVETQITTRTLNRERVKISQNIAASIAHELRNPVFAIASAVQLLRYRNNDDPMIERNLGRVLRETERLNSIIAALLEYGRPDPVHLVPSDPDTVWIAVLAEQRGLLESKALLVHHTPPSERATCPLDREQLALAFGNALANAVEAAPEGSDLVIYSTVDRDGVWHSRLHNDGDPVASELLSHVFEPLVTTKPGHAGTGLAVSHRVLSDHGGSIAMENGPAQGDAGGGVIVTFTLPRAREG
ncbi:MAG TPA: ATP-binding protein [Gemmatimonadaceae bacterium]|jgi:signal transduction histidine kinase